MSKIEEMAKEYCQGSSFDDACMMKPAYIAGANVVLREIEKAFEQGGIETMVEKINELKSK